VLTDIIIARAHVPLDKKRKEKIAFHCSMKEREVISAPDVETIYDVPINFEKDKITEVLFDKLNLRSKKTDLQEWRTMARIAKAGKKMVKIGIVGKYFGTGDFTLTDAYISVIEAIKHATYAEKHRPIIEWLDSEDYDTRHKDYKTRQKELAAYDGIIVPGGFGMRGVEGKIQTVRYCREHKIPYLGLCYGMQMAVIEFARHMVHLKEANTVETEPKTKHPVIDIMPDQKALMEKNNYGGTMRLGAYPAALKNGTIAREAYGTARISERHRHRYEVNPKYIDRLTKKGILFSGTSPDKTLMEIMELPREIHPFFVATQFHPEFTSRPLKPHPLFLAFIEAAIGKRERGGKAKKKIGV